MQLTHLYSSLFRCVTCHSPTMASMQTKLPQSAEDIIKFLKLDAHPEGGYFRETYRSEHSTAIYYLIKKDGDLLWHRIQGKDELWHYHAGDPVEITTATPDGAFHKKRIFGPNIFKGEEPQLLVPGDYWQTSRCLGEWTLFGCTVSPGFEFGNLEFAPKGFKPRNEETSK